MKSFLYVFGYWTPEQRRQNEQHGWDDEDSAAVLIDAETGEQALEWGRSVAEEFIRRLYDDPAFSWKAGGFADSLDGSPSLSPDALVGIPRVRSGEYPDWDHFPRR